MAWKTVLYEEMDHVAKITMNRPETANTQNIEMLYEMDEAFKAAEKDPNIRVVILAGAGKNFSAGHDISFRKEDLTSLAGLQQKYGLAEGEVPSEWRYYHEQDIYLEKCLNIRNLFKPTIAQVQGHAIAGGMMVACMCDLIVASDNAVFSNPTLRMAASSLEILVEPWDMNNLRRAKELIWTGDPFDAHEALDLGLINRVVPLDQLEEETLKLARRVAASPPMAVQLTKRSINRTQDMKGQSVSWDYHFVMHQLAHSTEEFKAWVAGASKAMKEGGIKGYLAYRDEPYKGI